MTKPPYPEKFKIEAVTQITKRGLGGPMYPPGPA